MIALLVVAAALWPPVPAPPPAEALAPPPRCTASLEVTIVEGGTAELLAGARVEVRPASGAPTHARTDATGRARAEGLCPGDALVAAALPHHTAARVTVALGEGEARRVRLVLDALHDRHSKYVVAVDVHGERPTEAGTSQSLAGAELARTRGQNLADTVAGISGVATLRGTAGGMGKPIIRGHQGRRTMILIDGVRHEGQDWGIDHAPEVDPSAADRITVIKGAGTTRFGAKAIGGVVMLESRPLPQRPSVRGEVGTVGLSNPLGGGGAARVDWAPRRGRGLAIRVEGNASRHRGVVTPLYPLDNTGAETWNAGTTIGYSSEALDLGVGYRVMRARGGICTCLRINSPEEFTAGFHRSRPIGADAYRADFPIERPRQEIWHHLAFARARVRVGKAGEIHALYSLQFNDRKEFDVVRQSVTGPQFTFGLMTHAAELRFEHARVELGEWSLVGAGGAVFTHQNNRFSGISSLVPDYRQSGWAVHDVERFVHERVELEIGARYEGLRREATLGERDYLGQQAGGRLDPEACRASGSGGVCAHTFHAASATLGALVRPVRRVPELTWRLQAHSSARIPAIDEQFMNGAAPSFPILGVGSAKIGLERSWGGETSLHYDGDWLTVEAAGYASYIADYIAFVPSPQEGQCAPLSCTSRGPLPVFAFRPTDAFFGGGELRFQLRAPRLPFGLAGSASWVRAYDLTRGGFLPLIPPDRYWIAGRYFFPDSRASSRGFLELSGTIVARQRRYDPDIDFVGPPDGYGLLGAGAGVEFPAEGRLLRLSLVGTNLLNVRYRDYTSLLRYFADEPGWGLQLRFSAEFDASLEK